MKRWHEVSGLFCAALVCGGSASAGEVLLAEATFDDGAEGWELAVSTEWNASLGHPGGCLSGVVMEPTNATAVVSASEAFLGDWSALDDGQGELRYDHSLISIGGNPNQFLPLDVVISGPGGTARWIGPTFKEATPYQTLVLPIEESSWTVDEGAWASIIADVESVRFRLETVDNSESPKDLQAIDNVRLVQLAASCLGDVDGDERVDLAD
ncbi:MAG: hypothetical protein ACF8MJ_04375 [Phycisphaerales bacterium JB050]